MHCILIVDDEPRHRTGLANMIKRLRPGYIVYEAKNGDNALQIIQSNHRIDIVVTDIKMPIMDGLQLIENLGQKVKHIKVIILSAYGYFEYAQKAISLGAFDYLLKPVEEASIIEMLNKVENEINRDLSEKLEKDGLRKQLDNTLPVYFESQLNKWVKGSLSKSGIDEIQNIFPFNGMGTVIIAEFNNLDEVIGSYSSDDVNEIKQNIKYWMKEVLNPIGHSLSFFLQDGKSAMVSVLNTSKDFDLSTADNLAKLNEFVYDLNINYGLDSILGIGKHSGNIFDEINPAFTQAQNALNYKFFLNDSRILFFSDIQDFMNKPLIIKLKEEELSEAIRKLSKEDAYASINRITSRMVSGGYPEPDKYKDIIIHLFLDRIKTMQNTVNEDLFFSLVDSIPRELKACAGFDEFNRKARSIIDELIDTLNEQKGRKNDLILAKCIEYIEKNYMKDLPLETVAEMFYFNPSYFSTLFKNHTGINFSQYLLNIRLKKGKELLESTNCKIYEIAEKIGFNDPKYFNRVFKKEFGMTPDEYRRLL